MRSPSDEVDMAGAVVEREGHIRVPLRLAAAHPHKPDLHM